MIKIKTGKSRNLIAGVDEVGRGPLAGDVVAAAVILGDDHDIRGLRDSKKIPEKQRNILYDHILSRCVCWSVARASVAEIDELNILHASMLAMKRAVEGLAIQPDFVYVDGNRLPPWNYCSEAVVQGDDLIAEISAASILAKVTRDREMAELDRLYPGYGFSQHKGYATRGHMVALMERGPCEIHRTSFDPVKSFFVQKTLF